MRALFRYVMLTVGFRYGSYAAGASLLAALVLFNFRYDPLGQFRLMLALVTIVVLVLAIRNYKIIYNQGNMNVTHGFMVSIAVGLVSSFFYAGTIWVWSSFSDQLWQLHIQDQLRTLEQGTATIEKNYNAGQIEVLRNNIINGSKSYMATFIFFTRFVWTMIVGFMISIYYRN